MKQEAISKPEYVARVLKLYTGLAETPARYSRIDRRLAEDLHEKQIELEEVEAAMILASARRLLRSPDAPKLGPIRSLHYFLPLIFDSVLVAHELQQQTKGIAITGDRLRADSFLIAEILDEEVLQQWTDLV